jgi:hypothetical protein
MRVDVLLSLHRFPQTANAGATGVNVNRLFCRHQKEIPYPQEEQHERGDSNTRSL